MNVNENGTTAIGAPNSAMRFITTPSDVLLPGTDWNCSTSTPWGTAQSAMRFARGLISYSTAGHGGLHVSSGLLARIPEYMRQAAVYGGGVNGWFEEDCESAIVIVCLPEFFPMTWRENAIGTMQSYYPKQWERFCQGER